MKLAGRKVRHAREDLGISAVTLTEILTDKTPDDWSHDMIRNLESGRRRIDPPLLRVLSEQLGRPVEYFLYQNPYNAQAAASADIPRYLNPEPPLATVTDIADARTARKANRIERAA